MATHQERAQELRVELIDKRREFRANARKMRLSLMDIDWKMECFDEELSNINRAERDTRPMCFDRCPEDGEAFCLYRHCDYCSAWKAIHGEEAVEQAERQTRWLFFWRVQESKEELEKMANVARHACIFKMNIEEELIARAWHPDRFVSWCLDTQELADWLSP